MNVKWETLAGVLALALAVGSEPASAEGGRWQLRMSGLATSSTTGFGFDPRAGIGIGLGYRLSSRIGIEIEGLTTEVQQGGLATESSFRMTPLLAHLDVHFTPGHAVDFHAGAVVGYVGVGEVTTRRNIAWPLGTDTRLTRARPDDEIAWGLSLGLDVPIGGRGSFLAFGATYLDLPLEVSGEALDGGVERLGDFDPLIAHVGYGVRF
ncbi:MAG TPA: outer membrane beta-barrel protein [Thermoanaerobaculia bacterium]|jgi:hypothetical protein|nr:outer membrane beta-barrel protein [Thermoanaerobaculia bacterium]